MIKILNRVTKNEILIATILFLLPLINFINPINIKQVDNTSLFFLLLFNLIFCVIFLFCIFLIKKIFFKRNVNNFYIIFSLFYLTLFLHNDIKNFIDKVNIFFFDSWRISKINSLFFNEISIFTAILIILIILYFQKKFFSFHKVLKTFIIFFVSTNLLLYLYNFYSFEKNMDNNKLELNNLNLLKLNKSKNKTIKKNIYYVVFDGMISLENAFEQNVIENESNIFEIKEKLKKIKIKYIPESLSNYNYTHLTLSSIFYLNSPLNEKSPKYNDNTYLYPLMLDKKNLAILDNKNLVTLPKILQKNNYNFYYFGNTWHPCIHDKSNNINCFGKSSNKFVSILESFYSNTILIPLAKNLLSYNSKENTSTFFLKNLKTVFNLLNKNNLNQKGNFIFVHSLIPHDPYLDKDCNYNDLSELTNYTYSYSCVLENIFNITNYLNDVDPTALIVFQADHGWVVKFNSDDINRNDFIYSEKTILDEKLNGNIKNEFYQRASIFNSIKAPKKCFEKNKVPKNNSNTIKFIFNCVFDYNLSYDNNYHFIGLDAKDPKNYGRLFKLEK